MSDVNTYPTQLSETTTELVSSLVIPVDAQRSQGPEHDPLDTLRSSGFSVVEGFTEDLAERLVASSKQPHTSYTSPDDPKSQFDTVQSVREWQKQGCLAVPLVKKIGKDGLHLAGFGWMSLGEPSEEELTLSGASVRLAVRFYETAPRREIAAAYVQAVLAIHDEAYGNEGVWLKTELPNKPATEVFHLAGFKDAGLLSIPNETRPSAWNQYMQLSVPLEED